MTCRAGPRRSNLLLARTAREREHAPLLRGELADRAVAEQRERLAEPSERRAKLVGDAREERLLQPIDAEELLPGALEIAPELVDLGRTADGLDGVKSPSPSRVASAARRAIGRVTLRAVSLATNTAAMMPQTATTTPFVAVRLPIARALASFVWMSA